MSALLKSAFERRSLKKRVCFGECLGKEHLGTECVWKKSARECTRERNVQNKCILEKSAWEYSALGEEHSGRECV